MVINMDPDAKLVIDLNYHNVSDSDQFSETKNEGLFNQMKITPTSNDGEYLIVYADEYPNIDSGVTRCKKRRINPEQREEYKAQRRLENKISAQKSRDKAKAVKTELENNVKSLSTRVSQLELQLLEKEIEIRNLKEKNIKLKDCIKKFGLDINVSD